MKIQRLIAILTVLLQTDNVPAPRLAEKFGVSVRTIYRDVQALESAGIPIVTTPGLHGGIGILEQYKINKKLFTSQDISTLLTGLHTVSGSLSGGSLNQTLEKIRALIPEDQVRAIELDARKLYIDMTPWQQNPRMVTHLATLQQALDKGRLLQFAYQTLKQEQSLRTVEPHQLVLKENQWYLRGFCRDRGDFRVFKLRRMANVRMLDEGFEPREFPARLNDFKDWFHERMIAIELLVDPALREAMLDRCREEDITPWPDGRLHIRLNFVESELGYGYLMQLGEKCECVAPAHVRAELVRRIDALRRVYPE